MDKNHISNSIDAPEEEKTITVREFLLASPAMGLDLEIVRGQEGLDKKIRSPRIQKLGLMLASFTGHLDPGRVVVFGNSELNYLHILDAEHRKTAISQLKNYSMCCIVVTKQLEIPKELLELSEEEKIPILRCSALSSGVIPKITDYLERRLASEMTIHGVLIEIFGLGVLVLGPSGIGKSECALELVLKGHRLVADDYVQLTRHGTDKLSGEGGKILKHHMELRGLGIINIKELFGISATGASQNIDFVVRLERWKPDAEYDRLGVERSTIDFMGVSLPIINIPVAPGRNVATLIEVAARIQLLRHRGYQSSTDSLLKNDSPKSDEAGR
ncbi:MAG: HPr(Ser) kinase/phosphatase [Acidobacteria bacterium]|nr:HPr(Ser) kinase/phosphatase [Acidobacteriota bacterium]